MSDILLQRLVNGNINLDYFKKWLLGQDHEIDYKCSQNEFLIYFLNFIHDEVYNQKKFGEKSLKCTPKKLKCHQELIMDQNCSSLLQKSTDFNSPVVRSLEKSFLDTNSITPKNSKVQLDSQLTNSYCSPVSPLYKEQSFSTPKNKKHVICLGDFITKHSNKKDPLQKAAEESSKRITPTSLNYVKANDPFKTANCFNNFNTKEITNNYQNRTFLAKERLKILSRKDSEESALLLNTKQMSLSENREGIEPQLNLITYQCEINIIADIYILILKYNLVLNITAEIYFLISLLLSEQYTIDLLDESQNGIDFLCDADKNNINVNFKITSCSDYFKSIHNVVYFALKCLETQIDSLKYYDKSTLKLFSLNRRVKELFPKFSEKLSKISEKKSDRIIEINEGHSNVCYNLDTDAKINFTSEISFLSFRKQRDFFYEILRIWEKNHLLPGWSFQIGLGGKIKSLLSLQSEAANFMHFARLFKAQLLSSCGKSTIGEDENETLPSNFPSIDPNKLSRLKNRLTTKQSSNGLSTLPHFPGHQEFYKEFILVASNHIFNIHLIDTFISEILELNGNTFDLSGFGESDSEVDTSLRKSYALKLRCLRVLAKFLGFIESIPYKSDTNTAHAKMFSHFVKIREKKTPALDIQQILLTSIKNNTVVLTIPWVVKYFSMFDYITLRLPYYLSVYDTLFEIYHSYEKNGMYFDYNASLVKFSLGWLFDLPHFPDTEYPKFCANRNKHFIRKRHTLDNLCIVDENILYSCCPYLEEIKKMLTSSPEYRNVTVKHITPVTAVESTEQISKKRLEQQLEEAFFNGQPESVRKSVEFVSERLASACVKHMCTSIVPAYKKNAFKEMKIFLEVQQKELQLLSPVRERNNKTTLRMKVSQFAQEKLTYLRAMCSKELTDILMDKIPKSIDSLLALDTLPQTKTTCTSITSRICRERITQWINSHLTLNIFMKDIDKEFQKIFNNSIENRKQVEEKLAFALPSNGSRNNHNEETLSGFHMSEKLRVLAVEIVKKCNNVDQESITQTLIEVSKSINERCDLNDIIISYILNAVLDIALLIIVHAPDLFTEILISKFVNIWQSNFPQNPDLFKNLLCPRNVALLKESPIQCKVWEKLAMFVAFLVKEKVLSSDNFESQCIAFFRKDWEQTVLDNVSYFMKRFVEFYKQNGGDCGKFTLLMEFLAEFCIEL